LNPNMTDLETNSLSVLCDSEYYDSPRGNAQHQKLSRKERGVIVWKA